MEILLVLPLFVLLFSAVVCILFTLDLRVQRAVALTGNILFFLATCWLFYEVRSQGIISLQVGGWEAPYGITLVADTLSVIMLMITAIIAMATFIYGLEDVEPLRKTRGFYPVFLFLVFGVGGSFLTGDIFNLYVWYEIMLVASFVLISLGSTKSQMEGAVKYVVLSFLASGFFLAGVGILYKATGSLNMADIARIMQGGQYNQVLAGLASIFFIIGFGIKSALFPFFFWLPASYHTPPASISSLMAGLLTKVGIYTFIRVYTLIFSIESAFTYHIFLWLAVFTMVTGVLGAMAQVGFRKILSFHIVSQIGYMVMGLAISTPLAIAWAIFYMVHHIIVKSNLFLVSGIVRSLGGSYELKALGGIYKNFPWVAGLFVVSAFSLAGIPPLSGFWSKFILIKGAIEADEILLAVVSLVVGLLTLFSMIKIWNQVFWSPAPKDNDPYKWTWKAFVKEKPLLLIPAFALAILTVLIGLWPSYLLNLAQDAAFELANPSVYINTVLSR